MFHYKSSKQAFIIPALIILLCLSCLVGSTFALFTSDPDAGTIGVITTSGSVKVDIVDTSDQQNSLVGSVLLFQTTAKQEDILFEPGSAFYTQGFRVKNEGTVPINFRLSVSEVLGDNKDEFNEAFEMWITKNSTNLDGAVPVTEFVGRVEAETTDTDIYYLFVKMKESVSGIEFQRQEYKGIGVTVYAVQGNAVLRGN